MKHKLVRFFSSERARSDVNLLPSAAGRQSNRLRRCLTANSGFTLVEMIVAVGLFAIVMVVCVGALLSLVNANRKAQALQSVMNNLNIALDGMVRSVRMGNDYDGSQGCSNPNGHDCSGGDGSTRIVFHPYCDTDGCPPNNKRSYYFEPGSIKESINGGDGIAITAPEVSIDDMRFYVVGTDQGDTTQPKVVIVIRGSAGTVGSKERTTFHIQATAVQRILDL